MGTGPYFNPAVRLFPRQNCYKCPTQLSAGFRRASVQARADNPLLSWQVLVRAKKFGTFRIGLLLCETSVLVERFMGILFQRAAHWNGNIDLYCRVTRTTCCYISVICFVVTLSRGIPPLLFVNISSGQTPAASISWLFTNRLSLSALFCRPLFYFIVLLIIVLSYISPGLQFSTSPLLARGESWTLQHNAPLAPGLLLILPGILSRRLFPPLIKQTSIALSTFTLIGASSHMRPNLATIPNQSLLFGMGIETG